MPPRSTAFAPQRSPGAAPLRAAAQNRTIPLRQSSAGRPFRHRTALLALLLLGALCGCGASARDQLAEAREALAATDYTAAIEASAAGLRAVPDAATAWALETIRCEALARSGASGPLLEQLARLEIEAPERLTPTFYSASADQLRRAGDAAGAVQVLDRGLKRHPKSALLVGLIGAASESSSGPEELDMLRSLGYVD